MSTTARQFYENGKQAGLDLELLDDRLVGLADVRAVNVWLSAADRYPWTTVWWPRDQRDQTIAWGPNFEFEVPTDTPVADLIERVKATLPTADEAPELEGDIPPSSPDYPRG